MNARYFDAHCHVQFEHYVPDRDALIERMQERGIAGMVVGVDRETSQQALALVQNHEHLFASVGRHPNHEEPFEEEVFQKLAESPKVVAIGECGLDYYRPAAVTEDLKKVQQAIFKKHITLAATCDKPLIIHARPSKGTHDAYQDLIGMLQEGKARHPHLRGDVHFFVGGIEEMQALTTLGFTVSFTAVITFAREYDAVLRAAPLANILSETDAPYVAPASRRGQRNDPLAVEEVVAKIAEIRGEDPEVVREALLQNAKRLFSV